MVLSWLARGRGGGIARQRRSGQSLAEAVGKGHMRFPGSPLVGLGPVMPLSGFLA